MKSKAITTGFRRSTIVTVALLAASCAQAEAPTIVIIGKIMAAKWERPATDFNPKMTFKLNSLKIGKTHKATMVDVQIDGIPEGAAVTSGLADFTVTSYYVKETQDLRMVREVEMFLDKIGEWAVWIGPSHGDDVRSVRPLAK